MKGVMGSDGDWGVAIGMFAIAEEGGRVGWCGARESWLEVRELQSGVFRECLLLFEQTLLYG